MKSTYFDDLDIENYFDTNNSYPTYTPGLISTKPQQVSFETNGQSDATPNHPERQNADGKLKEKLSSFVKSKKGKTILKITAGVGGAAVLIAFGPEIIAALTPVLPAMKALLAKKGIPTKGIGDTVKKFHETQIGPLPKDASSSDKAKNIVTGILKFFKNAKDRRAAGTQSPIDDIILNKADETIQKISDGTLSVDAVINDNTTTKVASENTTGSKTTGIDLKIVLIVIAAVFLLSKS